MLPVTQTDTRPDTGNCLQASVASLLGLPLECVPHFILEPSWEIRFMDFMADHDHPVTLVKPEEAVTGIAIGPTVRGTHHAVVLRDGRITWDPHPSRAGLTKTLYVYATETTD